MKSAEDSNSYTPSDRGPSRTIWPPAWLRPAAPIPPAEQAKEPPQAPPTPATCPPVAPATVRLAGVYCPRCKCQEHVDHEIHEGASIRRDCKRCGRFLSFPKWYGVLESSEN